VRAIASRTAAIVCNKLTIAAAAATRAATCGATSVKARSDRFIGSANGHRQAQDREAYRSDLLSRTSAWNLLD
jgi:hypothetical protein